VLAFIILKRRASKKGFVELKTETSELKDADVKLPETDILKPLEKKDDVIEPKQPTKEITIPLVTIPQIETQTSTTKSELAESIPKPSAITPSAKVKCKCGNVIEVYSNERPLKIKCSVCGKEGMLKAKPKEIQNKELSERSISSELATPSVPETDIQKREEKTKEITQKVKCKCGNVIEVTSKERPLKIKCDICGKEGMLKAKPSSENTQITPKLDQKEASAELADTSGNIEQPKPVGKVRCSACSEPIFVYTKERPIIVECPKCGKKGRLK
jgi:ribosomal protein S27E